MGPDGALYATTVVLALGGRVRMRRWGGTTWSLLGIDRFLLEGVEGDVYAVRSGADGRLFAGGEFNRVNTQEAGNLAAWHGTSWAPVSPGTAGGGEGTVRSLAARGDDLVIAGWFTMAGDVPSPYVALFTPTPVASASEPVADALALTVVPNPAAGRATAWIDGPAAHARVAVYDALGRRVALVFDGPAAGRTAVALPVGRLSPSVYVVRLVADGAVRTQRLVVAR